VIYCASHKNWIRNIRFSIIKRPLSQWNSDFATEADAPRSSFCESIANNSGYRYRLFHSRTKSAFLDSHMYVSGWLLCCHEPKYLKVSLHHALSGPDQDDIFCQDLIHCSGR